jgi:hypothetical protein
LGGFVTIGNTLDDRDWVGEARMLSICGLPRSTLQSWIASGLIASDPGGAYGEAEVLEAAIISALRDHFALEELTRLWIGLRERGSVGAFVARAHELADEDRFDLVIEPTSGRILLALDDAGLVDAVRHPSIPRPIVVIPLREKLIFVRDAFRAFATNDKRPTSRRAGRPPKRRVALRSIDGSQ